LLKFLHTVSFLDDPFIIAVQLACCSLCIDLFTCQPRM